MLIRHRQWDAGRRQVSRIGTVVRVPISAAERSNPGTPELSRVHRKPARIAFNRRPPVCSLEDPGKFGQLFVLAAA